MANETAPLDLLDYLRRTYLAAVEAGKECLADPTACREAVEDIDKFLAFARKHLSENQPVGTEHMNSGLSLRLQDSTIVPLVPAAASLQMSPEPGFQQITQGKGSTGNLQPSRSWGVTGNDDK